jgi:hypothetical protein
LLSSLRTVIFFPPQDFTRRQTQQRGELPNTSAALFLCLLLTLMAGEIISNLYQRKAQAFSSTSRFLGLPPPLTQIFALPLEKLDRDRSVIIDCSIMEKNPGRTRA